ncbi:MAG: NADH-quinone oxidoreductase subunit L [Verrucomicrobia bacterium]|nr:NADH-quinone oxidoreductase subunit L [Verrucomicrobiota bacterium]MCG2680508.1 NADH-quinone oxidoreductase subunit L [Kiritimatiellia bacterium]MBU4248231.1 NADH-quinone oxidoreductase subunit L [Verrucomicrobiota bacterium]MBU4290434.1 NADH-quinone oxidoreductase subunit L [Verrucomicrobiota bacterium]MBU4430159.1 NADH-quinone oxidoreductase subunit L [Verrucomicrobiota bacterium]
MNVRFLLVPILLPIVAGVLALLFRNRQGKACAWFCTAVTATQLAITASFFGQEWNLILPWGAFGWQFALKLTPFSNFILLAAAVFGFLICLYSAAFMNGKRFLNQYYGYFLFTLGLVNGAVLADNLIVLLFFWESLLLTLFGMIVIGHPGAFKTAVKACIISGVADLCLLVGIGMTIYLAGTMTISQIHLPVGGLNSVAFIFLMIGAMAKAGAMPFHSWIPDAAVDAPLPFMALLPGALDKLLGIYFLTRISLDIFVLTPLSWLSPLLMIIGSITILLAVMMALIQKDYKRLLSFHAISQVGYMILGIGTAVPVGIVGGLFHMINNVIYKSGLFLTGGAVEKQAGATDLAKLGGLGTRMPVTFLCFIILAASISGVPPFNGFFSKELVYDGALEAGRTWHVGWTFYAAALLGSFFTAASFLKLGHAAFLGKPNTDPAKVREAPMTMLIPMIIITALCILFGVWNALPLERLIQPILGEHRLEGHTFAGWPASMTLVILTVVVLVGAFLNHLWGAKRSGSGLGAADHIHYAPGLHPLYDRAERRLFDPYEIGLKITNGIARIAWGIDRGIDYLYDTAAVKITYALTNGIRKAHTGSLFAYLSWSLAGLILIIALILGGI